MSLEKTLEMDAPVVTFTDEGLQILNYARHSWPLSSEGSSTFATAAVLLNGLLCRVDTGHICSPSSEMMTILLRKNAQKANQLMF